MKKIAQIRPKMASHWVGNGFLVQSLFSYNSPFNVSPFLLMDYNAPMICRPNMGAPIGVGEHPHRGFETVTVAYKGEVSHKDSAGGGGTIGEGDVQWMTAGSGILHEEFHSEKFSCEGGEFEMVQLWVNLPAKDKMTAPKYQAITAEQIPEVAFDGGTAKIIAGDFEGTKGTASTFSPINMWTVELNAEQAHQFKIPESHNLLILVMNGEVVVNGEQTAVANNLVTFESGGADVLLEAKENSRMLILSGEPFDEPVVGYGPFVMNTEQEIREAIDDFRAGKFGKMQ